MRSTGVVTEAVWVLTLAISKLQTKRGRGTNRLGGSSQGGGARRRRRRRKGQREGQQPRKGRIRLVDGGQGGQTSGREREEREKKRENEGQRRNMLCVKEEK